MTARIVAVTSSFILAAAALATPLVAQTYTDDKELAKSVVSTQRQAIVAENMNLTDDQGKLFWPLYKQYGAEMDGITDRKLKLMEDYARKYNTLTDVEASSVMSEYFAIQKDEVKAKEKWFGKFTKQLPIKTVTRFFQIEYKLDAIIREQMTEVIPLVRDSVVPAQKN